MYGSGHSSVRCAHNKSYQQEDLRRFYDENKLLPRCYYQHRLNLKESSELPFFPKFEAQCLCKDKLFVVWFEVDFSQTHYHDEHTSNGSNACTLIAILLSAYCSSERVFAMCSHNHISYCIIQALGIAMLNGNKIYNRFKQLGRLPNVNLSIPEAIICAGQFARHITEWKSILYMQPLSKSLCANLQNNLDEWNATTLARRHTYLYIILISDSRSVLFILNQEEKTITFVDSHLHSPTKGAVIAIVHKNNLSCLCSWLTHVSYKYNHSNPNLYELSFLYYRR